MIFFIYETDYHKMIDEYFQCSTFNYLLRHVAYKDK